MSDESKLNPELKKLEATLGRLAVPPASINRDDLMYQSGWAAAVASFENESKLVGRHLGSGPNKAWFWPATAIAASVAAILLGTLLMFQTGDVLNSSNHQRVADGEISRDKPYDADLNTENDRTDAMNSSAIDDEDVGADVVELVLVFPEGQILKSGLAFLGPSLAAEYAELTVQFPEPSLMEEPVGHRKLLEGLLPTRPRRVPTWPSLFF